MDAKPAIGIIVGSTASGKTAASVYIAKRLDAEVVSADSIQIYKKLDIGSAKPSAAEMDGVPHHLIGEVDPMDGKYSVAEYKQAACGYIDGILARGRLPLFVGGTGLYVNALTYPLNFTSAASDEGIRKRLLEEEAESPGSLYDKLKVVDNISAERLHKNDTKRIIRALEVFELTGKTLTEHGNDFQNSAENEIDYSPRMVGITMPREMLYNRINARVDAMMAAGLLSEVKSLIADGVSADCPAMQGLGYKQLVKHLTGEYTLDEAVEAVKLETRHFAKRQMTWFRRDKRIVWFDASEYGRNETMYDEMCDVLSGGK